MALDGFCALQFVPPAPKVLAEIKTTIFYKGFCPLCITSYKLSRLLLLYVSRMSLKITDVLSRFGKESDVSIWISQAHLAKDLLKLEDLAVIIPLFLDGSAFAIYDQLSAEDKKSSDRIEAALKTAIAVDKFNAYEEFRTRMWKPGETVDVFLSDLKRLSKLAEIWR